MFSGFANDCGANVAHLGGKKALTNACEVAAIRMIKQWNLLRLVDKIMMNDKYFSLVKLYFRMLLKETETDYGNMPRACVGDDVYFGQLLTK